MAIDTRLLSSDNFTGDEKPVRGTDRLWQKFVIELLTIRGSMKFLPNRGCGFLPRVYTSAKSEHDIIAAFAAATSEIRRSFASEEQADGVPLSERLAKASLDAIVIDQGSLVLKVTVINRLGAVATGTVPPINLVQE